MTTIHDVAKAAGVSISTVSYALSGKRSISADTRRRIDDAIATLDYMPNAGARMLAGARTDILALSAPIHEDGHLPTHMRFVTAVVETARRHDYDVLLLATDDAVTGIRRVATRKLVDGVVMMGVTTDDVRGPMVRDLGLPASFIGIPAENAGTWCVDLDFAAAGRQSAQRLADLGHRTVGVIGHPHAYLERHTGFVERFATAFDTECARLGITATTRWPEVRRGAGADAMASVLDDQPGTSAIVFHCNEPVVEEGVQLLRERGLRVPDDVSLLAACASYEAAALSRPLSAIPLPIDEMCHRAVEVALAGIDGAVDHGTSYLLPQFEDRGSLTTAR